MRTLSLTRPGCLMSSAPSPSPFVCVRLHSAGDDDTVSLRVSLAELCRRQRSADRGGSSGGSAEAPRWLRGLERGGNVMGLWRIGRVCAVH
jgi:hypothetical protein